MSDYSNHILFFSWMIRSQIPLNEDFKWEQVY